MQFHREKLEKIFRHALDIHAPGDIVSRFLPSNGLFKRTRKPVNLVATGKCALNMARGAYSVLGDRIRRGLVITNSMEAYIPGNIMVIRSSHPVPDERSLFAARELTGFLESAEEDSLFLFLLSGGTSAMVSSPAKGITLGEKQELISILMKNGIEIEDLNLIRSYFSDLKGGKLLRHIRAERIVELVVSDVLSNDLRTIGSGMLHHGEVDNRRVISVLEHFGMPKVNSVVAKCIGIATYPLEDEAIPQKKVESHIIDSNSKLLSDLAFLADKEGYSARVYPEPLTGSVGEAVTRFYNWAMECAPETGAPQIFIAGAETGVIVKGTGKGGRNSEFAMRAAPLLAGTQYVLLAAGTDGTDGSTSNAGAIIDGLTSAEGAARGLDHSLLLANSDSGSWCDALGCSLITGHTGVNLADVVMMVRA